MTTLSEESIVLFPSFLYLAGDFIRGTDGRTDGRTRTLAIQFSDFHLEFAKKTKQGVVLNFLNPRVLGL